MRLLTQIDSSPSVAPNLLAAGLRGGLSAPAPSGSSFSAQLLAAQPQVPEGQIAHQNATGTDAVVKPVALAGPSAVPRAAGLPTIAADESGTEGAPATEAPELSDADALPAQMPDAFAAPAAPAPKHKSAEATPSALTSDTVGEPTEQGSTAVSPEQQTLAPELPVPPQTHGAAHSVMIAPQAVADAPPKSSQPKPLSGMPKSDAAPTDHRGLKSGLPSPSAHPAYGDMPTAARDKPAATAGLSSPQSTVAETGTDLAPVKAQKDSASSLTSTPDGHAKITFDPKAQPSGELPPVQIQSPDTLTSAAPAPIVATGSTQPSTVGPATVDLAQPDWPNTLIETIQTTENAGDIDGMTLTLTPERLGNLQIRLELLDGQTHVHIVTETPEAARVFAEAQHRLADLMARAGLEMGGQSTTTGFGESGFSGRDGQGLPSGSQSSGTAAEQEASDTINLHTVHPAENHPAQGVDLMA